MGCCDGLILDCLYICLAPDPPQLSVTCKPVSASRVKLCLLGLAYHLLCMCGVVGLYSAQYEVRENDCPRASYGVSASP